MRRERAGSENRRAQGAGYEAEAAAFLEAKGYRILERNFRCRLGEIDLIAALNEVLVFVEVKYRADENGGGPLAAVDRKKQQRISRVALYYLQSHCGSVDVACRFDVIGMTPGGIRHIESAFDYTR